jgi:hypothetical protein
MSRACTELINDGIDFQAMRAHRRRTLRTVGIDFSAPEADMRNWLNDSEFTPYPALAFTLLKLLEGKRLRQPVQLDVIRGYYEEVLDAPSPRSVSDVDFLYA